MDTKINWFEIPSSDFSRATKFYEALFDIKLKVEPVGPIQMGIFPDASNQGYGCVIQGEGSEPGANGPIIYLDSPAPIEQLLARVEPAGGTVKMGKTELPNDIGFIAHFIDTEGNRLALHQPPGER
ncbi:MAG: glyoxalase [Burkholderiales bacterium RIFCSPLOWO2_02_FULL_57_36]|nr:MAG: glyoxalase [Burkholderiales bacterium RIFCSPLOWO2_02_FULL_57_36]